MKPGVVVIGVVLGALLATGSPVVWVPLALLWGVGHAVVAPLPPRPACVQHVPPGTTPAPRTAVPQDVLDEMDALPSDGVPCAP